MAKLTRALSKKSKRPTLKATDNTTSLQASEAGRLPFASLGGQQAARSGPAVAHVPRLASRVKEKRVHDAKVKILSQALKRLATSYASIAATNGWPTPDIFGRNGGVFYATPDQVARSLESRLRQRMAGRGSPLYALRWRSWTMVLGAPIFALRALERTTSGSGFTGWPTPKAMTGGANSQREGRGAGGADLQEAAQWLTAGWKTPVAASPNSLRGKGQDPHRRKAQGHQVTIQDQVHLLAGWTTPTTSGQNTKYKQGGSSTQAQACTLAGWTTPQTRDHKDGATTLANTPINAMLSRQVTLIRGWATPRAEDGESSGARLSRGIADTLTAQSRQLSSSHVPMAKSAPFPQTGKASLNPAFSLWLTLGPFATAWARCAQRVT